MAVFVQSEDFDIGQQIATLKKNDDQIGAVVTFTGYVRNSHDQKLISMELEHYPAMTERALQKLEIQAVNKWSLSKCLITHRYGVLKVGEQIMMVATASGHRQDAFEAATYLMDYLKTDAPFWKKEHFSDGANWVASKLEDEDAKQRWADN